MKKFIAVILCVLIFSGMIPTEIIPEISLPSFSISTKAATNGTATLNGATLYYSVENGEATITDCNESISGDVTIPSILGGYPVTSIGSSAFYNCSSLTSITIPDSVKTICVAAFSYCTSLTEVTIGNGVIKIDAMAFSNCYSLSRVNITDLASWCNIEYNDITYDGNPLYYAKNLYINGMLATDIVIPNSVTEIKKLTFVGCTSLTSIKIPDSVISIGNSAFRNCSSLKKATIGKGVTSINDGAFFGCLAIDIVFFFGSITKMNMILKPNNTCLTNAKMIYYHNYHQYDDWVISIEPTCINMGGKYHTCLICEEVEYELILPTGKHIYENDYCIYCGLKEKNSENDINGDGKLDSADVVLVKKIILDGRTSNDETNIYDTNGDAKVNVLDLIYIKKIVCEYIKT